MTLMTTFWEEGGREKRKTVGVSHFCLRDPRNLRWNRRERGTGGRREKKLELKNLGTSAGYGYLPVAQARYRELQRARQGIYHLQPGFARLGILYHTGTHIFLQRFRQTEHGWDVEVADMLAEHLLHLVALARAGARRQKGETPTGLRFSLPPSSKKWSLRSLVIKVIKLFLIFPYIFCIFLHKTRGNEYHS